MLRRLLLLALAGTLAACSLVLDTDKSGLPCGSDNECLTGYVCDANGQCVSAAEGGCKPACGAYEKCVRSACVPTCDGRPCGAGQECSEGECVNVNADHTLGANCEADADCPSQTFCLKPYGGGAGMCTRACGGSSDCDKDGHAPTCVLLATGSGGSIHLCAPSSFTPCTKEADCAAADLSCGAYAVTVSKEAVLACRTRVPGGKAIDETCSAGGAGIACANGLCLKDAGTGEQRCLTPCSADADCSATVKDQANCLPVALVASGLPKARASLCVPGGASTLLGCDGNASVCHADAPDCVLFNGETTKKCAQTCADSSSKCPAGAGGTLSCKPADTGNYCDG